MENSLVRLEDMLLSLSNGWRGWSAATATSAARGAGRTALGSPIAAAATLLFCSQLSGLGLLGSGATAAASIAAAAATLASAAAATATAPHAIRTTDASTLAAIAALFHFSQSTESGIGGGSSAAAALAFISSRWLVDDDTHKEDAGKHSHDKKRPDHSRSCHDHVCNQEQECQVHASHAFQLSFQLSSTSTHHFECKAGHGWSVSNRFSQFLFHLTLEFGIGVNCLQNLVPEKVSELILFCLLDRHNQDDHQEYKIRRHEE